MPETTLPERTTEGLPLLEGWEGGWWAALCERCDWRYLLPAGRRPERCPHCFSAPLTPLEGDLSRLPYVRPPELVVPATLSDRRLRAEVERFAEKIPYPPEDLSAERLRARLQPLALPLWLVDVQVRAGWRAEVGFDYEVVSHQSRYDDRGGGWREQEVQERRVRWEPRLGRLRRVYHNVIAPALEAEGALQRALGPFRLEDAQPYPQQQSAVTLVRLPDRAPEAAWTAAEPRVREAAGEECRQAAGADHVRDFRWSPHYADPNWTLLLRPVYTTYYLDDEGQPQRVLVHGQTGRLSGERRGSMRRAQRRALTVGIVAAVIFALSLVLGLVSIAVPPLLLVAGLGVLVALLVGLGALIPILQVWQFNRREAPEGGSVSS